MNINEHIIDLAEWVEQVADFQRQESKQKRMQVTVKEKETDYVTDVDLKSEAMLIQFIRSKYPEHGILTEERGRLEGSSDYQWVIDPIDGTTNFIHGYPMSSISVALQHRGVTVAGMVCAP
ncbi:inositol monophosphatase family protein, partial [Mycobacterium tuberculosis]